MMAGNPNYWVMNGMHPQSHQLSNPLFVYGSNNNALSESAQDFPVRSWSQLLLGGLGSGEDERLGDGLFQQPKKVENWEDGQQCNWSYHHHQVVLPVSSPTSCVTNLSNNLNFTADEATKRRRHNQEHSSQCNSTSTGGGVSKKARVQQSSAQPILKVRKEKLGERITALHQLVSPFGKTDTASVLSEATGYIRFLQGQIEALSSPYLRNSSVNSGHHHQSDSENGGTNDLKSRGLCLVPISCTENVENENGADYWAPAAFGSGF